MSSFWPTVLLVDNSHSACEQSRRLRSQGFGLLVAASRRQALRLFVEQDVDFVVLAETARALDPTQLARMMQIMRPEVPVVVVGKNQEPC